MTAQDENIKPPPPPPGTPPGTPPVPNNTEKPGEKAEPPFKSQNADNIIPADEKPTGNFFLDAEIFFKQLSRAFKGRYALWENTFLSALKILRVIENQDNNNTRLVLKEIEELDKKFKKGIKDYQLKLTEVLRFSELDLKKINQEFKDTLKLLRMEIQEYMLQQEVNKLYQIYE